MRITAGTVARAAAGAWVVSRLARGLPPARALVRAAAPEASISLLIPARDEASRLPALLACLDGAPGINEVVVVDDESTDDTADLARRTGARVVSGDPLPHGWAGKAWALRQGVSAAHGEWVVALDADTRPDPALPAAVVARAIEDGIDLTTVAGRFDCPTAGGRWLHAAMLASLVYRYGPPRATRGAEDRVLANGQCTVARREDLGHWLDEVRGHVVEDVALARHVATAGGRVVFLDGAALLSVRMFETFAETFTGWGRSLALPGVEPGARQLADLAVLAVTQVVPLVRLAAGRADAVDLALLALRLGTLAGTRRAYEPRGAAFWLSPLADPLALVAIGRGITRRTRHSWRGRSYGPGSAVR